MTQFIGGSKNACPCCTTPLLRHVRHGNLYWFCGSCYQEMPNLSSDRSPLMAAPHSLAQLLELPLSHRRTAQAAVGAAGK